MTAVANKRWDRSPDCGWTCCVEFGLCTSRIDIAWELVRDAETRAPLGLLNERLHFNKIPRNKTPVPISVCKALQEEKIQSVSLRVSPSPLWGPSFYPLGPGEGRTAFWLRTSMGGWNCLEMLDFRLCF